MTITEQARELGVAIANSDEYKRMLAAHANIEGSAPLKSMLDEFNAKRTALVEMLQKGDYDSGLALEMSNDIERLQGQMTENEVFADMMDAEEKFSQLISAVDTEINACIGGKSATAGCSGNCGSCGGCAN